MKEHLDGEKRFAACEAVKFIKDGQTVGLGTGSTAKFAVIEIGEMIKNGLDIKCVSTSEKTTELALSLKIPMVEINSIDVIDITIDGADEFNDQLMLIKGGGGALLREKIIASITKKEIIIADSTKKVEQLGRFGLPIEIVPFALNYVSEQIKNLSGKPALRSVDGNKFVTDQGNYIIDADFGLINDPLKLADELNRIEGIVCHGLFLGLAHMIIYAKGEKIEIFRH